MTEELILQRLKEGWDLADRGTGWWLSAPRIAYKRTETVKIDDSLVDSLIKQSLIKTELPYTTLWARLV